MREQRNGGATTWGKAELSAWGAGVSMHGIPGDVSSPSRFVRVAYTNTHYPQQNNESANVSRLFHTLASVQMVEGMSKMGNGQFERTLFTSGYSGKTNTYYMNTYEDPAIRSFCHVRLRHGFERADHRRLIPGISSSKIPQ